MLIHVEGHIRVLLNQTKHRVRPYPIESLLDILIVQDKDGPYHDDTKMVC